MTSSAPTDVLEQRAAEQRRQLHNSVAELKTNLRERLDVKKAARQYLWPAAGALAFVGLLLGYGITGVFTRD